MALRAKAGELAAVRARSQPGQVRQVQPLLQLDPDRKNPADLLDAAWPITFVPGIRSDATARSAAALGQLGNELGAGVAVRVRPDPADRDTLGRLLELLPLEPGEIHVVLDLQYVPEATAPGSTGPATLAVLAGPSRGSALGELVRAGAGNLRFGDYGAAHPIPGKGFRSKPVAPATSHHLACPATRRAA